jgi:hypothetical protein
MNGGKPMVLLAGLDDALVRRVVTALEPLRVDFQRTSPATAFVTLAGNSGCDVVIVGHSGDLSALEMMVEAMRSADSSRRHAALVVICQRDLLDGVEPLVGRGVSRAIAVEELGWSLCDAVSSLLEVAPRAALQAPVRLTPMFPGNGEGATGTTENLSSSGMLVQCPGRLPVGSTIQFEISLPGQPAPIRGSARVVRTADPEREGVEGVGARFLSFLETDGDRFRNLLSDQLN